MPGGGAVGDADGGLDGRHHLGNVSHIAGADAAALVRRVHPVAQQGQLSAVDSVEGKGGHHVVHPVLVRLHPAGRPRHPGRPFHDPPDLLRHRLQPRHRGGAEIELSRRVGGYDVGRFAPVGDDAVDHGVLRQVLAQGVDAVVGQDQGVQGVDPLLRRGGRVGGFPPELNVDRQAGDVFSGSLVPVPRMDAEGGVHVPEEAFPHEAALGAAVFPAFLSRGSVHADFAARLVDDLPQGGSRQAGGRPKEVVPAAVAQAGQGVVLRQEDQHRTGTGRLIGSRKAGAVPCHIDGHLEAFLRKLPAQPFTGEKLVIADLRTGVDVQGDLPVHGVLPVRIGKNGLPYAHDLSPLTNRPRLVVLRDRRLPRNCSRETNTSRMITQTLTMS